MHIVVLFQDYKCSSHICSFQVIHKTNLTMCIYSIPNIEVDRSICQTFNYQLFPFCKSSIGYDHNSSCINIAE